METCWLREGLGRKRCIWSLGLDSSLFWRWTGTVFFLQLIWSFFSYITTACHKMTSKRRQKQVDCRSSRQWTLLSAAASCPSNSLYQWNLCVKSWTSGELWYVLGVLRLKKPRIWRHDWSSLYIDNLSSCEIKGLKKFWFEWSPWPLWYRVQCSTSRAIKPTGSWDGEDASEYMKDDILELRRKIWRHDGLVGTLVPSNLSPHGSSSIWSFIYH